MNRKIKYWMKVVAVLGLILWSAVQIQCRIQPQQILTGYGYHFDILAYEIQLIVGFYALLHLQGKERVGKRLIQRNRQVKAC